MKHFKTVFILLFICSISTQTINAQWGSKKVTGNNQVIEETRTLSPYIVLDISGSFQVELVKGTPGEITIIAESNLIQHIVTEVDKDMLTIEVAKKINLDANKRIKIIIPFSELEEINLSGSGSIVSNNTNEADELEIEFSGSGSLNLPVNISDSIKITKSGSGSIQLEGSAQSLDLKSTGSGKFMGENLVVEDAEIKITGSGIVSITCKDKIVAKVTGSGNIMYKGDPSRIDTSITGSGKIEKL